jgi:predicted nucleic acid-binding protein
MILLDTNVVSEPTKPRPDANVRAWIDSQSANTLFICTPVLAELHFGVHGLPAGARRGRLESYIEDLQNDLYADRILSFDASAAVEYGRVMAMRIRIGRPIRQMDALIAAIACAHRAVLVTRNVDDFVGLDIEVLNPFPAVSGGR